MTKITRAYIHLIRQHSNWSKEGIDKRLKRDVYNDSDAWKSFLQIALITLGVGFAVAGVIFFFAYNWADLNRFVKLGLIGSLILITALLSLQQSLNASLRKILLTASAMFIGALFAVFGQIYQTGANAYDFFMAWTMGILIWVIVANYAPLWLMFMVLVNTTLILYTQQVAQDWSFVFVCTLLFLVNAFCLIAGTGLKEQGIKIDFPHWLSYVLALATITYSTAGMAYGIFERFESSLPLLVVVALLFYAAALYFAHQEKQIFYIATVSISLIVLGSCLLMKIAEDEAMLFGVSLFIIASITGVIWYISTLQKQWKHGK